QAKRKTPTQNNGRAQQTNERERRSSGDVASGAEGSGDFRTVQEAIGAVPQSNRVRTVIQVAPGFYREAVYVPKTKNLITLAASQPETTILSWDNTATRINHHQSSRAIGKGTFGCGSTIVEGEDFIAENITFENSAPQGSGQAVAIRVTADRCAFYNCRFLGWQDTLYLHYGKQYLRDCYIEGSVDFIFGNATALLEHCHIHCKSAGFVTAQRRKSSQEPTGYVFLRCFGPGCCLSNRVTWARELLDEEAEQFLLHSFIDPDPERPWLVQRMAVKLPISA
ncbi:pectinesterase 31-like, partial [Phoenix dactylifera]|uniref:Pectinesterase n=1 Tax=Phoenix dactylifera TaxID=42345 RepID=A0A8B8ZD20_PHODC